MALNNANCNGCAGIKSENIHVNSVDQLRSALESSFDADTDYKITVAAGTYNLKSPLMVSGGFKSLSLCGEGNVIFTSRIPFNAEWKPFRDGIWQCKPGFTEAPDMLWKNGKPLDCARFPNNTGVGLYGGFSADALSEERIAGWADPKGGHVLALHHAEWGSNDYIIDGKDENGELILRWVGDNNRGSEMHPIRRMVENVFEELDFPGEWFYDKNEDILYYYPRPNELLTGFEYVSSPSLIQFHGTSPENPLSSVAVKNITFCGTARTLFTDEYERPLRGDWGIVRNGAALMSNTENVTFHYCSFRDIGGNAVVFSGYNKDCEISGCSFEGIGATGVLISGLISAVRDPSFWDNDEHHTTISDFTPGPKDENYPRSITVSCCSFHDIGVWEKQTAAVCMSISAHNRVSHCTVSRTARAGINISDGTFGGHIIEDNDLFDCVRETADHGPINCWGRDRYWSLGGYTSMGLRGKKKRPYALLDAIDTTIIRHNRITANYAFGIDIDDGASNYDIYDNLCLGVGIKLREGFNRRVHNNLLIGAGFDLHMSFEQNCDLIYSNISVFPKAFNTLCINDGANTISTNNTFWNYGQPVVGIPEDAYGTITEDPMIADIDGNDFTLSPSSPSVAAGFVPFPTGRFDFGCPDAQKPPLYIRIPAPQSAETLRYFDLLLSDIDGDGMRSAAGLPDTDGVFVAERDVLGLFCKMGIHIGIGDVIRSIGGKKLNGVRDFIPAFESIPENSPSEITFYRDQRPLTLSFIKPSGQYISISDTAISDWNEEKKEEAY